MTDERNSGKMGYRIEAEVDEKTNCLRRMSDNTLVPAEFVETVIRKKEKDWLFDLLPKQI